MNNTENTTQRIIDDIFLLSQQFSNEYESECDTWNNNNNNSNSLVFNIGAPKYSDADIVNNIENGIICCRGFESCAYTTSITTDLGSILCVGDSS